MCARTLVRTQACVRLELHQVSVRAFNRFDGSVAFALVAALVIVPGAARAQHAVQPPSASADKATAAPSSALGVTKPVGAAPGNAMGPWRSQHEPLSLELIALSTNNVRILQ